jgi:hypothetical protein
LHSGQRAAAQFAMRDADRSVSSSSGKEPEMKKITVRKAGKVRLTVPVQGTCVEN